MRWLSPPRTLLFVSLSLVLAACSSGSENTEGSQSTVGGDDDTAMDGSASDDDDAAPTTPSEPETSAGDVEPTVPVNVNLPPLVIGGAAENDAGVEPEPSMTAEPAVPGEPEMTAEPVPVEPEPVGVEPETVVVEPEPVGVEPEPVATEPEPAAMEPEPVVMEPEPSACDTRPQCDLVCAAGTVNPVDEDGCVNTCECEGLPDACSQCKDGEECIQVGQDADARFACAEVMSDCQSLLPCGCFEDYQDCSLSLQNVGMCMCEAPVDPCGGCDTGKTCIFQAGGPGPSRYLCAAESNCPTPGACWCIQQQGACQMSVEHGVCECDNGLD